MPRSNKYKFYSKNTKLTGKRNAGLKYRVLIMFLAISLLLIAGFYLYKFFTIEAVDIYEEPGATKIVIATKKQDTYSDHIYAHLRNNKPSSGVDSINKNNASKVNNAGKTIERDRHNRAVNAKSIQDTISKIKELQHYKAPKSSSLAENKAGASQSEDGKHNAKVPRLKFKERSKTIYLVEVHHALDLPKASKLAQDLMQKHAKTMANASVAIRRTQSRDKNMFSVGFINFKSFQEAKQLCHRLSRNGESCIVVQAKMHEIQSFYKM